MAFDHTLAEIRFGTGMSPSRAAPADAASMLARLQRPDSMARAFPVRSFDDHLHDIRIYRDHQRARRKATSDAARLKSLEAVRKLRRSSANGGFTDLQQIVLRATQTRDGFRERLTTFWADHFTAVGRFGLMPATAPAYIDDAIRPHLTGRFSDMLRAVITHPLMLTYLDQARSTGPETMVARKRGIGLNENLAREVLELHTLGVGAPYDQADVRQLAELFTGLSLGRDGTFVFREGMAEPGAETVLGNSYGGGAADLADIHAALDDLARHPSTARHLARKLAVHFVSDDPAPALIDHIAAAYRAHDGALLPTYAALLEHRAAWAPQRVKARQPFDFICAALRALDVPRAGIKNAAPRTLLFRPMRAMGQRFGDAPGPDGWPEAAAHWITPQGMAARIQWAMHAPARVLARLPDPRSFVDDALGGLADDDLRFAARAAETRAAGIGLVLSAPAFHRR